MEVLKTTILLFAFMLIANFSDAQTTEFENSYVRIYVQDARTAQASSEIDLFMRSQDGVLTSRMDKQTGQYLCIFKHDLVSIAQIKSWILTLGYHPTCQVSGIHGNGIKVKTLSKSDCISGAQNAIQK